MRNMKIIAVAAAACFCLSLSFGAAYIKFDGVDGESKDKDHKGWIDVVSVSGLEAPKDAASGMATGKRDHASGMATGKRQHKPITITKEIDKATPLLAKSAGGGGGLPTTLALELDGTTYVLDGVKILNTKRQGNREILTVGFDSIRASHDAAMNSVRNMKAAAATDHNSSRSNKTSSTKAQDYNSSRSNNESTKSAAPANHNTTRSNRTSE